MGFNALGIGRMGRKSFEESDDSDFHLSDSCSSESEMTKENEHKHKQKKTILKLEQHQPDLIVGDVWYIIDAKWFRQWKCYVNYDSQFYQKNCSRPGQIKNEKLLKAGNTSLKGTRGQNYEIISKQQWEALHSW